MKKLIDAIITKAIWQYVRLEVWLEEWRWVMTLTFRHATGRIYIMRDAPDHIVDYYTSRLRRICKRRSNHRAGP